MFSAAFGGRKGEGLGRPAGSRRALWVQLGGLWQDRSRFSAHAPAKARLDETSRRLVFTTCLRSHEAYSNTSPVLGAGGDCRLTVLRRRSPSTHGTPAGDEPALVAASSRWNGHQLQRHGCGSAPRYSLLPASRIQRARIGDRLAPRLCGNEQLQPCLHAFDKNTACHLSAAANCSRKWQVPIGKEPHAGNQHKPPRLARNGKTSSLPSGSSVAPPRRGKR